MGDLTPVFALAVIFIGIIAIAKIISDNKLRHKLIDKGLLNEKAQYLYPEKKAGSGGRTNLKWGMILVAIGLAFSLPRLFIRDQEELTLAALFLFVGVALLLYYALSPKTEETPRKKP
jgi:hypothetical protein